MIEKVKTTKALFFRQLFLVMMDIISAIAASTLALLARFNFSVAEVNPEFLEVVWKYLLPNVITVLVVYVFFKLYQSIWMYAGIYEMERIAAAGLVCTLLHALEINLTGAFMPRSYWFFYMFFLILLTVATRFYYRFTRHVKNRMRGNGKDGVKRVMIIGAGSAADMLLRELLSSSHVSSKPVCLIDDNKELLGKTIRGVRIVGTTANIEEAAKKYNVDEILIAIPSAGKKRISEIAGICNRTSCTIKTLPGVYQLVNDEVAVSQLRPVEIEDLLGRDVVKVDLNKIKENIKGKTVLVTGGGGSIGSELCRQIADANPARLVIVDIYENNAYDIQQELKWKYPNLNLVVLIASVRNLERIDSIFAEYTPNIVFHAAAHKHVPLMEDSPNEAIKNNVFGTLNTAKCADKYGVERFVLISTDKAVNPTNVMGASKRMCEMVIQAYARKSQTQFVAVRFGNVLGSNGSVIPLFKKQIAEGGPVKVTHPDIIRYFMTIPEAVSLVMEAGACAGSGEIFVLDMGEPVKIADLARNLIRLSGYVPDEDIMIEYTGLRPGEKLYEERLMSEEGLLKTENDLISVARPIMMDDELFFKKLEEIYGAAYSETEDIRKFISDIVPTYKAPKEV